MKKAISLSFFAAVCLITILTTLLSASLRPAHADVGEVPNPGGMITTGDKNDDVEMMNEEVVFTIYDGGDECPLDYYEGCWYAHVTADFYMGNTSSSDESLNLFYPYPSMLDYWGGNGESDEDQSINFEIEIDSTSVDYTTDTYTLTNEDTGVTSNIPSLKFPATFPAAGETHISISYDTRLVYEPKSQYGTFIYLMQTGSHWAGSIGEGTITFTFPNEINESVFMDLPEVFEISEKNLIWEFTDLEPDAEDNVSITFAPELIGLWNDRESYFEGITSSVEDGSSIPGFLTDELLPEGYYQIVPSSRIAANAVLFLTDPVVPGESEEEYYPNWGWLAPLGEETAPFVEYELDAVYEVSSIDVFSGIPIYVSDTNTWEEVELYTILDRPKELTLTFSDGTEATVELEDSPDKLQSVDFEAVETSSVKVTVTDTYPGDNGGGEILGMSRMYLGVGDKVREKDVVTGDNATETPAVTLEEEVSQAPFWVRMWENFTKSDLDNPIIIVLPIALVLGGVAAVIYLVLKRRKGKKASPGNASVNKTETTATQPKKTENSTPAGVKK